MPTRTVHFPLFSKKHVCRDCHAELANHEELVAHAKKEHKRGVLKCKECNKEFIYESDRWKHIKEAHKSK